MTPVEVTGVGMVTALGSSVRETIDALTRGERRTARTRLVDVRGDRITGAFALPLHPTLTGARRAALLTLPALTECVESAPPAVGKAALFLCAPCPWGSFANDFAPAVAHVQDEGPALLEVLATELEARGIPSPPALRFVIARGHAAGALAIDRAAALIERGDAAQAFVVGVDAHGDRATLERLDLSGSLRSRRSPGGFVPGEASIVLCIRPASERSTSALLSGIGVDEEKETPSTARALTSAISQSIVQWGGAARSIATVAIDLNGERERANEWTFAATRTLWRERATPLIVHPADPLGDIGSASLPLLVGLLSSSKRHGPALAVTRSWDGLRGAVIVV